MTDPKDLACIGNGRGVCAERVAWCRNTQFAGDHHFCDAHARAEEDFGQVDSTGGQFIWFWRDQITQTWMPVRSESTTPPNTLTMQVDKPFSVRDFIDKGRAAGQDALGTANDPDAEAAFTALEVNKGVTSLAAAAKARELVNAPVNHHTREPNQPMAATIVEGDDHIPYIVMLTRTAPGVVEFTLTINGKICGKLPFDNLVKAATRIDPDHAAGTEKQIQQLRRETATARAEMYDWQAKALQLEEKLRAFQEASKA